MYNFFGGMLFCRLKFRASAKLYLVLVQNIHENYNSYTFADYDIYKYNYILDIYIYIHIYILYIHAFRANLFRIFIKRHIIC